MRNPLNSEPLSHILWYPELLLSLREIPLWRPRGHPMAHANCSMPLMLPGASVNSRVLPVFIRGPNLSPPLHDWQLPGKLDGYGSLSDSCTAISNCLMSSELRYRLIRKLKYKDSGLKIQTVTWVFYEVFDAYQVVPIFELWKGTGGWKQLSTKCSCTALCRSKEDP